jgi:hypothetical protein
VTVTSIVHSTIIIPNPRNMQFYLILSYTLRLSAINILFNIISVTLLQIIYLRWGNKTSIENSLKNESCRLFCVSSLWRVTCSPWPDYRSILYKLATTSHQHAMASHRFWPKQLAMAKFISPKSSSSPWTSLATRCDEFIQKCPYFAKICKFNWFYLHSSFKIVQKHKTYNMR